MADALGPVHRVALDASGRRWALLRELSGADEGSVGGHTTLDAVRLLDRLLVGEPGTAVAPGGASTLTLPERDLVLAAVWATTWSPRMAGTLTCASCGQPFDYDFDLGELVDQVAQALAEIPNQDGVYTVDAGIRFRLPTGEDERAVIGLPAPAAESALLARCLVEGDPATAASVVEKAMEQVGSGLDIDIDAACHECGTVLAVRFQMQTYLLGAIVAGQPGLADDVHRLARSYGWALSEILALPRRQRRAFIEILDDVAS